jgi:S1-C subfamily serine protease
MDTAGSLSSASGAAASWGCAIPITRAMTIAQEIRAGSPSPYIESGHRGVLGVEVTTRGGVDGAVVVSTTGGDAANSAGIVAGDVITAVAGIAVPSVADFNQVMQDRLPGDTVTVTWLDAGGQSHSASVTLSPGPPA